MASSWKVCNVLEIHKDLTDWGNGQEWMELNKNKQTFLQSIEIIANLIAKMQDVPDHAHSSPACKSLGYIGHHKLKKVRKVHILQQMHLRCGTQES